MITMRDVNEQEIRELFDGDYIKAYQYVVWYGNSFLRVSERELKRLLVIYLKKQNYTADKIKELLGISDYFIKTYFKKESIPVSQPMVNALCATRCSNPITMISKASSHDSKPIYLYKNVVERLMIEDLLEAGWSPKQVHIATGFSLRRVMLAKEKIRKRNRK